jgi:hypothetical protein
MKNYCYIIGKIFNISILQNGSTPLLQAYENEVDTRNIYWLIKARGGYSLMDMNCDGFTHCPFRKTLLR